MTERRIVKRTSIPIALLICVFFINSCNSSKQVKEKPKPQTTKSATIKTPVGKKPVKTVPKPAAKKVSQVNLLSPEEVLIDFEFVEGVKGKALRVKKSLAKKGGEYGIAYPTKSLNFPESKGTISFWVKGDYFPCVEPFYCPPYRIGIWWHKVKGEKDYRFYPFVMPYTIPDGRVRKAEILKNEWYHITLVWDCTLKGNLKYVKCYVNGECLFRQRRRFPFKKMIADKLFIGMRCKPGTCLDEIIVDGEVLSEIEVKKMYFGQAYEPGPNTRFYLNFDNGNLDAEMKK